MRRGLLARARPFPAPAQPRLRSRPPLPLPASPGPRDPSARPRRSGTSRGGMRAPGRERIGRSFQRLSRCAATSRQHSSVNVPASQAGPADTAHALRSPCGPRHAATATTASAPATPSSAGLPNPSSSLPPWYRFSSSTTSKSQRPRCSFSFHVGGGQNSDHTFRSSQAQGPCEAGGPQGRGMRLGKETWAHTCMDLLHIDSQNH